MIYDFLASFLFLLLLTPLVAPVVIAGVKVFGNLGIPG
jgi:hypothetical protein